MNLLSCLLSLLYSLINLLFGFLLFLLFSHLFSTIFHLIEKFRNLFPLFTYCLGWSLIDVSRHLFFRLILIGPEFLFTRLDHIKGTIICRLIGLLVLIKFPLFLLLLKKFPHSLVLLVWADVTPGNLFDIYLRGQEMCYRFLLWLESEE